MGYAEHPLATRAPLVTADHGEDAEPLDVRYLRYGGRVTSKGDNGAHEWTERGDVGQLVYWKGEAGGATDGPRKLSDAAAPDVPFGHRAPGILSVTREDGLRAALDGYTKHADDLQPKRDVSFDGLLPKDHSEYRTAYGHPLPYGAMGLLVQAVTQDAYDQTLLPALELVAHHDGIGDGFGATDTSTRVYGLTDDGWLNHERAAGLHSHLRVTHDGQSNVAAWWMHGAPDGAGYGVVYGEGDASSSSTAGEGSTVWTPPQSGRVVAFAAEQRGGPFHLGHARRDKHRIGTNIDGESVNPLHLSIGMLIYRNEDQDGPLHRTEPWYEGADYVARGKVEFGWNAGLGKWDWSARVPRFQAKPPTETPPTEGPPVPGDGPPTDKVPPGWDPSHNPEEESAPSRYYTGATAPGMPDDGRHGSYHPNAEQDRYGRGYPGLESRGGPTPLTAHLVGIPKASDGRWDYAVQPITADRRSTVPRGIAESAALFLSPPGYWPSLADAVDQSSVLGTLVLGLYDGQAGGGASSDPVAIAWGRRSFAGGDVYGGPRLLPDGTAGAKDLCVGFTDSGGTARAGTLKPVTDGSALGEPGSAWVLAMRFAHVRGTSGATITVEHEHTVNAQAGVVRLPDAPGDGYPIQIHNRDSSSNTSVRASAYTGYGGSDYINVNSAGGEEFTIAPNDGVTLFYDATDAIWYAAGEYDHT